MEKYNVKLTGKHPGIPDMEEENLTALTVIRLLEKYGHNNCSPNWKGEVFELSDDYTMTIIPIL